VPFCEPGQLRHPRHAAIPAGNFADDTRRIQARNAGQVDRSLGLAGAHQHAALAGAQGEHMPRSRQVHGFRPAIDGDHDRSRAVGRGDPGGGPFLGLDADAEGGLELGGVLLGGHLQRNLQFVETRACHRHADEAAAVGHHEVDGLGRDLLRGNGQVAFVLAILVIDDDQDLPSAERRDRGLHRGERAVSAPTACQPDVRGHCFPLHEFRASSDRTTYFPIMSHSRLTLSPGRRWRSAVCAQV
jgi:hypothetical protein